MQCRTHHPVATTAGCPLSTLDRFCCRPPSFLVHSNIVFSNCDVIAMLHTKCHIFREGKSNLELKHWKLGLERSSFMCGCIKAPVGDRIEYKYSSTAVSETFNKEKALVTSRHLLQTF